MSSSIVRLLFTTCTNLEGLLGEVRSALTPGGRLVFSVEHPIVTAPLQPGWSDDVSGRKSWPVSGYLQEGESAPRTGWQGRHQTASDHCQLCPPAPAPGLSLGAPWRSGAPRPNKLRPNPRLPLNANARPSFCSPRSKQAWTCRAKDKGQPQDRGQSFTGAAEPPAQGPRVFAWTSTSARFGSPNPTPGNV